MKLNIIIFPFFLLLLALLLLLFLFSIFVDDLVVTLANSCELISLTDRLFEGPQPPGSLYRDHLFYFFYLEGNPVHYPIFSNHYRLL
jgi:hypothetical protein